MSELCNFCGKGQHEVNKLIIGEKAGICNNCINLCSEILLSEQNKNGNIIVDVDPLEIKCHLDKFVVSQDHAKEILSVAVTNHVKRINSPKNNIEKSNIMLLGPTGSGKTLLVKTIADYLQIPFVISDATRFTEAGYVGEDVDSVLIQLLQKAGGSVSKAQTGIIFIDEIDKIARKDALGSRDVGTDGVQQALLKLVEGSVFSITPNRKSDATVDIDTSNILFIASGAFGGLDKIKRKKQQQTSIGFSADVQNQEAVREAEFSDLIEFGMIPEFAGRFPVLAEVEALSDSDMLNILSNVENNLVTQYKHLFNYNNVALSFDSEALSQVVQIAITKKTGARGLRAIMEKALLPHMFNITKYVANDINDVRITKSLINNPIEVKKA